MSNIAKAFAGGKAFIPFITCGDPDLATTAAAVNWHAAFGLVPLFFTEENNLISFSFFLFTLFISPSTIYESEYEI